MQVDTDRVIPLFMYSVSNPSKGNCGVCTHAAVHYSHVEMTKTHMKRREANAHCVRNTLESKAHVTGRAHTGSLSRKPMKHSHRKRATVM